MDPRARRSFKIGLLHTKHDAPDGKIYKTYTGVIVRWKRRFVWVAYRRWWR
jgi:hypothetical protein